MTCETTSQILAYSFSVIGVIGLAYCYIFLYPDTVADFFKYRIDGLRAELEERVETLRIPEDERTVKYLRGFFEILITNASKISILRMVFTMPLIPERDFKRWNSAASRLWEEAAHSLPQEQFDALYSLKCQSRRALLKYSLLRCPIFSVVFIFASGLATLSNCLPQVLKALRRNALGVLRESCSRKLDRLEVLQTMEELEGMDDTILPAAHAIS